MRLVRVHWFHILLGLFLAALIFCGGSSRYDRIVQVPVRLAAIAILIGATFLTVRSEASALKIPAVLLGAVIVLVGLQLLPLPPALWTALPGREGLAVAAPLGGFPQPWRPLALVPDLTINALLSLTVPAAMLYALAVLDPRVSRWAYPAMLGAIVFALVIEMAQLITGADGFTALYDTRPGPDAVGIFANRNHQALLLAIGIPLLLGWEEIRSEGTRGTLGRWAGGGLVAMLVMILIATGSRAGLLLGAIGLLGALAVFWSWYGRRARPARRSVWLIAIGLVAAIAVVTAVAVIFGRGEAIDRLLAADPAGDKRARALPVLLDIARTYLPVGSGFGSFDAVFRRAEPFELLEATYFNQAHNDLLQVVLEGGVPALLLLLGAVAWFVVAALQLWRARSSQSTIVRGRAASIALLLMLVASAVDYPLRTPTMMAIACVLIFQVATALREVRWPAAASTARSV